MILIGVFTATLTSILVGNESEEIDELRKELSEKIDDLKKSMDSK